MSLFPVGLDEGTRGIKEKVMIKFAALAATGVLLAMPAFAGPAAADPQIKLAQADVRIGVGDTGARVRVGPTRERAYTRERVYVRPGYRHYGSRDRGCSRTVVIRDGRKTVIKRCP
jgi:hypothetical protein